MRRVRKEIHGNTYIVGTLTTSTALEVLVDLAQLLAPAFDGDAGKVDLKKMMDEKVDSLIPKLFAVAKDADKKRVTAILKTLAGPCVVERDDGPHELKKIYVEREIEPETAGNDWVPSENRWLLPEHMRK